MTATATRTPAGVLRAAADWFEEDPARWGREFYIDPDTGCRCTLGAICYALAPADDDGNPFYLSGGPEVADAFAAYLVEDLGVPLKHFQVPEGEIIPLDAPVHVIGDWNDHPARTAAEVIAALRAAADRADGAR